LLDLQSEPRLWIRVRKNFVDKVLGELPELKPFERSGFSETFEHCGTEDLHLTESFKMGWMEIQDSSSQAVGAICKAAPGETWWDACAGEGGKTLHLSDQMGGKGLIWATDRSNRRLQILRKRMARAEAFNIQVKDWANPNQKPVRAMCHGILVDAPCTGIGTWQRNPQARWTLQPNDISELKQVQIGLLEKVAAQLRPQGRLIYSVCTLSSAETVEVVQEFDALQKLNLVRHDFENPFGKAKGSEQFWWPEDTEGNGMFVAQWIKA
jgi:16S rRNA (cytosine967-C5)-methyltransferase